MGTLFGVHPIVPFLNCGMTSFGAGFFWGAVGMAIWDSSMVFFVVEQNWGLGLLLLSHSCFFQAKVE